MWHRLRSALARDQLSSLDSLMTPLVTERYPSVPQLRIGDPSEIVQSMDLALRLGVSLLSCGAPTSDVQAAVFAVGTALGLTEFEVDINFSSITLSVPGSLGSPAQTAIRVVRVWHVNHARLAAAHELMLDLAAGRLDRAQMAQRLQGVEMADVASGWLLVTLGFGVLAAAIVVSLGGDPLTAAISFGSAVLLGVVGQLLSRRNVPKFFGNACSAVIASLVAVALSAADASAPSALVVAGGIMALLPGMSLVVAAQEAIGRFPVTAAARLVDLTTETAGIVTGVLIALLVADRLGVSMVAAQRFATDRGVAVVVIVAAGVAATASSASSRSRLAVWPPAALTGALGVAVLRGVNAVSDNEGAAIAAAATAVGLVANLLARWRRVPPVLFIAPGIIPLLPGLTVYRGLLEYSQGHTSTGTNDLVEAATIAVALAAGVLFGELITAPRRRSGGGDPAAKDHDI